MALNHLITPSPPLAIEVGSVVCQNVVPFNDVIAGADRKLIAAMPGYVNWAQEGSSTLTYYVTATAAGPDVLVYTCPAGQDSFLSAVNVNSLAPNTGAWYLLVSPDAGVTKYIIGSGAASNVAFPVPVTGWHSPPGWSVWVRSSTTCNTRWTLNVINYPVTIPLAPVVYTGAMLAGIDTVVYTVPAGFRASIMSTGNYAFTGFSRISNTAGPACNLTTLLRNSSGDWVLSINTGLTALSVSSSTFQIGILEAGDSIVVQTSVNKAAGQLLFWMPIILWAPGTCP